MFRCIIAFITAVFPSMLSAQQAPWEWVHPKPSGNAFYTCVAADASTAVLIGSNEEILRTTDQGQTWTIVHPYEPWLRFLNLASVRTQSGALLSLAQVYTDVLPAESVLRRSVDAGLSWERITEGFDLLGARDIDAAGGLIAACGATTMLLSEDNGDTWRHVDSDPGEELICVAVRSDGALVTGGRSGTLWLSGDTARTWSAVTVFPNTDIVKVAWYDTAILCWTAEDSLYSLSVTGELLAASNHRATFPDTWLVHEPVVVGYEDLRDGLGLRWSRSTDGGHTWSTLPAKRTIPFPPLCALTDSVFIAGSGAPIRSTDAGATWEGGPEFPSYSFAQIAFRDDVNGVIVTEGGEILESNDSGLSWVLADSGAAAPNEVFFLDDSRALLATKTGRVLLSRDAGHSWKTVLESGSPLHLVKLSSTEAIAAEKKRLWRTSDAGETWTVHAIDTSAGAYSIEKMAFADNRFGALYGSRGFYVTTDGGWTWTKAAGQTPPGIYSIACPRPGTIIAVGGMVSTGMIHKSDDAGATWTMRYVDGGGFMEAAYVTSVCFRDAMHGLVVGIDGLTLWTADGGDHWFTDSGTHTLRDYFTCGFAGDSAAFAIGYDVIMRTTLTADPVSVRALTNAVSHCEIVSCAPLPVRDRAEILVRLAAAGNAELRIADIHGRIVKCLKSSTLPAGEHQITAALGELAPGSYLLQLRTSQGTHIKPIVILR